MSPSAPHARHRQLVAEIRRHDRAYYVLARPEITDFEYDRLYQELLDLEQAHPELVTPESPSQRVGGGPTEGFERVTHLVPMLSLEKTEGAEHPTREEEPDADRRARRQDDQTLHQLRAFDHRMRAALGTNSLAYIVEPKVDGVSITVHYRDGKLHLGATRGLNGREGDDITNNLRTVRSIPLQLATDHPPALLEARGEAYMATKDFDAVNASLRAAGEAVLPNPRNATAGALKQLDPEFVAHRPIRVVFYGIGLTDGVSFESHSQMLLELQRFGLPIQPEWWVCEGIEEVLRCYRKHVVCDYRPECDLRSRLPYEIDGVVVKLNSLTDTTRIPDKTKTPGYAIVHKPIPWITPAETVLQAITVQVGRTGVLTPVAELDPVFVQGSTVSRATLHNEDEIRRKDIRIGDTVVIRKAGMVIPEVVEVLKSKRPPEAKPFDLVAHIRGKCPACGGPIVREKVSGGEADEVAWRCQNVAGCPAQKTRRVEYFAQRKALDIESLGGVVAEKLVESGLVNEPLDLFNLTLDQLAKLNLGTADEPRVFGEKHATKVIEALERAKLAPLHRWIHALAIPDVGEQTAWQLAQVHRSLRELAGSQVLRDIRRLGELKVERDAVSPKSRKNPPKDSAELAARKRQHATLTAELRAMEHSLDAGGLKARLAEVGPVAAASVLDFFASPAGQRILERLGELGIQPEGQASAPATATTAGAFAGMTFVLTGTLPGFSREEASRLIREAGGSVSASVSKHTDYVLAGENAGSKLEKARGLSVPVLDETRFRALLGGEPPGPPPRQHQAELL